LKFYIAGTRNFVLFCCCDLDLDPDDLSYEHDPYPLEISSQTNSELSTLRLRKLSYSYTYRETTPKHYDAAPRGAGVHVQFIITVEKNKHTIRRTEFQEGGRGAFT